MLHTSVQQQQQQQLLRLCTGSTQWHRPSTENCRNVGWSQHRRKLQPLVCTNHFPLSRTLESRIFNHSGPYSAQRPGWAGGAVKRMTLKTIFCRKMPQTRSAAITLLRRLIEMPPPPSSPTSDGGPADALRPDRCQQTLVYVHAPSNDIRVNAIQANRLL